MQCKVTKKVSRLNPDKETCPKVMVLESDDEFTFCCEQGSGVYLGLNRDTDGCRCRLNARCRRSLSAHRWYLEQSSVNISLPHCVSAFPYKNDICSFLRHNVSRSGPGKPQHRLNRPVKQAYQQHLLFESLGVAWGWRDANRVLTVQSDRPA